MKRAASPLCPSVRLGNKSWRKPMRPSGTDRRGHQEQTGSLWDRVRARRRVSGDGRRRRRRHGHHRWRPPRRPPRAPVQRQLRRSRWKRAHARVRRERDVRTLERDVRRRWLLPKPAAADACQLRRRGGARERRMDVFAADTARAAPSRWSPSAPSARWRWRCSPGLSARRCSRGIRSAARRWSFMSHKQVVGKPAARWPLAGAAARSRPSGVCRSSNS